MIAVSRLHWDDDTVPAHDVEIPHLHGVPVREAVSSDATVHRFVPNRLGIAEMGDENDIVHHLADIDGDVTRFRVLLRRLAQLTGVMPVVEPDMACSIILTRGVPEHAYASVSARFPGSVAATPSRLAEFPGGLQLVATTGVGNRFDEFAARLEKCLAEDDR